jgi:hypothetical protein
MPVDSRRRQPLRAPEELATVAALREAGRRYSDIAVLIGRPNGKAVWQAVRAARSRAEAIEADTSHRPPPVQL